MPKKKKTRKQKVLADMRHKFVENVQSSTTLPAGESQIERKPQPQLDRSKQASVQSIATSGYQYLYSDLIKTVVLTFIVVAFELVLGYFFF